MQITDYSQSSKDQAADFLRTATRFDTSDISLGLTKSAKHRFTVLLTFNLHIGSFSQTVSGIQDAAGTTDFFSKSRSLIDHEISLRIDQEKGRSALTLGEFESDLKNQDYKYISNVELGRTQPGRVFYDYQCQTCSGHGKLNCPSCNGCGHCSCWTCSGGGTQSCGFCGGTGGTWETTHGVDFHGNSTSETSYSHCSCLGGHVSCGTCGGSGQQSCSNCGGYGSVTCETCTGLGSLTEITSIRTTATPEFTPDFGQAPAKELLEFVGKKIAFNCLLDHALLLDSRARKEPACKRFEIDYAFELDSCKVVVSSEDVTGTLTYVGSRFVLLEADGILMQLMQGDFADLTNFASGKSYFLPWYNWISSRVLHNFMESEVHQNLVTFAGGHSVQELHEHLGRTLTPEYIESAILSLIRILRIRLWWSRAHLFLMVLFCGIPAVCAFALLKEPMHRTMTAGAERIFIQPMETFALIASIIGPVIFSGITLTFIFRHIHAFRVKRCGGIPLVDFASIARIRFGRTSGYIAMSLALVLSVYFFHRYPRWIDTSGKLYGIVQFTNPPEILEVKVPKFAKKTKTKVNK